MPKYTLTEAKMRQWARLGGVGYGRTLAEYEQNDERANTFGMRYLRFCRACGWELKAFGRWERA